MAEQRVVDAKTAYNLTVRVLCDIEPSVETRFVYLFGQTEFNQKSVLSKAAQLWNEDQSRIICIMGGDPIAGYPGGNAWTDQLVAQDIPWIFTFRIPQLPKTNTFTEAQALVRFLKKQNEKSVYIVGPPFHQVRCFISAVTAALAEYPELKIYNKVGATLDWDERGIHSQGVLTGARKDFIDSEWERIEKYMNLVSPEEALKYLENRDK